jgi:BirA family biotin operon repressor/biotin-[acetyl-CoA-carboxylase] ligase
MANFDLERIRIETGVGGLEHHAEIGSTNDRGLELVKRDDKAEIKLQFPFLILADRQTAGRGQFHRPWIAEMGSLTCSLCTLTNDRQADALIPLAVGLAVCEAIEKIANNIQIELKWPNDLLIGKRKLGGILIEQFSGKLVIGIGLNVNSDIDLDQNELRKDSVGDGNFSSNPLKSISLRAAHGQVVDLTELTIEVVKQVKTRIAAVESGRQEVLDRCHRRMIFREREIELRLPDGEKLVGHYRGLSDAGELLIDAQGKQHSVASALAISW